MMHNEKKNKTLNEVIIFYIFSATLISAQVFNISLNLNSQHTQLKDFFKTKVYSFYISVLFFSRDGNKYCWIKFSLLTSCSILFRSSSSAEF